MGTGDTSPVTDTGYPRRTGMGRQRDGARVVVRGRESRPHGEGEQGTDQRAKPQERSVDSDHQADKAWLLSVQRKLYQWSRQNLDESYRELWNWIIDPRNLRCAWARVATNQGKRTAGIDGKTVGSIRRDIGEHAYLEGLRSELRAGTYVPSPCRRKLIPKPGKPGQFRALGIPMGAS